MVLSCTHTHTHSLHIVRLKVDSPTEKHSPFPSWCPKNAAVSSSGLWVPAGSPALLYTVIGRGGWVCSGGPPVTLNPLDSGPVDTAAKSTSPAFVQRGKAAFMRDASWYLGVEIKQAQLILLNRKWGRCFNVLLCHHQQRRSHLLTRFCYLRFTGPIILYGLTPFQNKRSCIVLNPLMPDQEIMDGKLCPFSKIPKLTFFFNLYCTWYIHHYMQ